MKKDNQSVTCPDCKNAVSDNQPAVECDVCGHWFHNQCQNVSDALYAVLNSSETDQVSWYCDCCKRGAKRLQSQMIIINERQSKVENQVKKLDEKQTATEKRMNELESKMAKCQVSTAPKNATQVSGIIATSVEEIQERQRRNCNVIIFGLAESGLETGEERKKLTH